MWEKYQRYLEWWEREHEKGYVDYDADDTQPEDYDEFCWNCEEWNRYDDIDRYLKEETRCKKRA